MSGLQPNETPAQGETQAPPDSRQAREAFFASLPSRARELVPNWVRGAIRIDLTTPDGVEHWYVRFAPGRATVSREDLPADAVLKTTAEVLDQLIHGNLPMLAASVRFDYLMIGDVKLPVIVARFFYSRGQDPRIAARANALHGERWRQRLDATLARRQVA